MAWSDKQLRNHKRASAGLSVATSTLGIGALGLAGARAGAGKGVKLAQKAGRLKNVTPKHIEHFKAKSTGIQTGLLTTSAGVGGIGGYNYAAIQSAEAKRRPRVTPVKKAHSDDLDMGLGFVRHGEIRKAYNPERSRKKRLDVYEGGAKLGAVGLAGGAGVAALKPAKQVKTLVRAKYPKGKPGPTPELTTTRPRPDLHARGLEPKAFRAGLKHVGTSRNTKLSLGLAAGAVGAAAAAPAIGRYKRGNGRSYRPLHAD